MRDKEHVHKEVNMLLTAPTGVPVPFSVIVKNAWPANSEYTFEIKGTIKGAGAVKTNMYSLYDQTHTAYFDFFEQLANDYGLRLPQNRRTAAQPIFKAAYKEVLLNNLAPGMLYGYGDPAVIRVEEGAEEKEISYYLVATSNDAPDAFPIIRSTDLVHWEFVDYVFPNGKKPQWAAEGEGISDFWAPETHRIQNEYRVYFVGRDKHTYELCIGAARSAHPKGPFIADAEPVLRGNVIDPHIFIDDKDTAYLFWKKDNNDLWPQRLLQLLYHHPGLINLLFDEPEDKTTASFMVTLLPWIGLLPPMERFLFSQVFIEAVIAQFLSFYERLQALLKKQPADVQDMIRSVLEVMKTGVYAQPLSGDGLSLIGAPTKIIENDLDWEAHLVEGIWVTQQQNRYYLIYAGNDFSTDQYGIGVAIADALLGPYKKLEKPFLQSTAEWWAPGHPSLTTAPDGTPLLFLHAYFPGQAGYKQFRVLLSTTLIFEKDRVLLG